MEPVFYRQSGYLVIKDAIYQFLGYTETDNEIFLDVFADDVKNGTYKDYVHHFAKSEIKSIVTTREGKNFIEKFVKNKKLGKNNALRIFKDICLGDCYVNVDNQEFKLCDIQEEFNFTKLIKYLSNLTIPYDVLYEFFDGCTSYCDMNGNPQYDEHDYFVIEQDNATHEIIDIYSWTEVAGRIYRLNEYGKTWREGV